MNAATNLKTLYRQRREQIADEIRMTGDDERTYQEIADSYGISRERVRQIAKLFGLERRPKSKPAK